MFSSSYDEIINLHCNFNSYSILARVRRSKMPGSSQQKKRERELPAALCQKLDVFLPTVKRKATGDGQLSDPLVTETNSATAAATEEIECSDHSDKCKTTCSEMVAPDSNEPEITTQQGASTMHCSVYNILASLYD